jgi:hypothetical protein
VTGEERIFAIEDNGTDSSLDGIGIELDATVVEEKKKPAPGPRFVLLYCCEGRCMLRIAATALLTLLLLPGHSLRAAEPAGVINFACSGTAEANDTRRPAKKIGLIINIDERTVTVSGPSVVAHIDRLDDVSILFGAQSTAPGDIGIMGGIDRITGDTWYLTFTKGKNKKLKRGEMFELVCKGAQ